MRLGASPYLILVFCALTDSSFDFVDVCFESIQRNQLPNHVTYCETITTDRLVKALPKGAKKIFITDQNLTEISKFSFADIIDSKELHINNCSVRNIEPGAFENSTSFQIINLRWNHLKEVKKGTFNVLSLKYLYLSYNKIEKIEEESFANLPHLREVDLCNNKLISIEANYFLNLPSLESLHFENNSIQNLPNHFFETFNDGLNVFVSNNKIKSVQPDVFHGMENRKIYKFYIDHNELKTWTEDLSTNIVDLKIDHNNIGCFDGIFKNIIKNSSIENFEFNPYDCICLKEIKTWTDEHGRHSEWFKDIYLKCREEAKLTRRRPVGVFRDMQTYFRNFQ